MYITKWICKIRYMHVTYYELKTNEAALLLVTSINLKSNTELKCMTPFL